MTDKELLLIDLSSRLFYNVKCLCDIDKKFDGGMIATLSSIDLKKERVEFHNVITPYLFDEIKPYLRPMSSMTEEEKEEYEDTFASVYDVNDYGEYADSWHEEFSICSLDWLNAHHFDYRGLIPKGLAIAVSKENNPYEKLKI